MDYSLDIKNSYLFKGLTKNAERRYIISDRLMTLLKRGALEYSEGDMEMLRLVEYEEVPTREWVTYCLAFARAERQLFRWVGRGGPVRLGKPLTRAQFTALALHSRRFVDTEGGYEAGNRDWRLRIEE